MKQLADPKDWAKSSEFFQKEYSTDAYIAKMKKPIVTFMHGNTRESLKFQNKPTRVVDFPAYTQSEEVSDYLAMHHSVLLLNPPRSPCQK